MAESRLLTSKEVAARLGVSEWTVWKLRQRGEGPRWVPIRRAVRYRPEDVECWVSERARQREEVAR